MSHFIVNQNIKGKISLPLYYYDCKFQPGTIIKNGIIIRPTSKLQKVILRDCFVEEALLEGTKLQGDTSILRSTVLNCNLSRSINPVFNDCDIRYEGKYKYSLPILDGTFTGCSLFRCKIIEPTIKSSLLMENSALVYDEQTLIARQKGFEWKFINTEIINAEIEY